MRHETRPVKAVLALLLCACLLPRPAFAVVGQAEKYDEFKQDELEEFQDNLLAEERSSQLKKANAAAEAMQKQKGKVEKRTEQEIEQLKRELLSLPKRDRFRVEADGLYVYDSNINRQQRYELVKDDVKIDTNDALLFDLSGRKTDLRWELRGAKRWNIEFPENDIWQMEERLRYRRRYFKKIIHTQQSAIARNNSKTIEIDNDKVRYDSQQNTIFNYPISPKFSINTDSQLTHHQFVQEAFDQDSTWEATFAPSLFWLATPKTRLAAGYRFGANRIRSKTGDANSHEVHVGYFGRVTRKSSLSFDFAYSRQNPRSTDTAKINTVTTGVGYILQMTPKTQLLTQIIRQLQNSTSNAVTADGGTATTTPDAANTLVTKNDSRFENDSISMALNSRLTSKLIAVINLTGSRLKTRTSTGSATNQARQFTFPMSYSVTYLLRRNLTLTWAYTFTYRTGDARSDFFRDHLMSLAIHMTLF